MGGFWSPGQGAVSSLVNGRWVEAAGDSLSSSAFHQESSV